jgi:glycosyltransferase involved in cell wall biosynthesis
MSNPVDPAAPVALTFILPTRNRRQVVGRAIESCLQADQPPDVSVKVLVVDGNSTDGSFEELQQRYGQDARVRLVRQQGPKGFMAACFFAVPLVQTPFATFMYDDDVLSPFWGDLPREMGRRGDDFVMGFSGEAGMDEVFPFERVTRLRVATQSFLLRAYFGFGRQLSRFVLPFSPICCLTRTDCLRDWLGEVERFTRSRPLREYFMMQRAAGPDLMIYLHSIANHPGEITVFDGPMAQFSTHSASLTSELETTDLTLGYWLAHVWLCNRLRELGCSRDAGSCAAYAVRQGFKLLLKRLRRGRREWAGALFGEIFGLLGRTLVSGAAGSFLKSFFILIMPRKWRPQFGLSTRTESLLS